MHNLANRWGNSGRLSDAIPLLRELLRSRQRAGAAPSDIIATAFNLAMALYRQGELDEAEKILTDHIELSGRVNGADHPSTDRLRGLSVSVLVDQGRQEKAVARGREVVAWRRSHYAPGHPLVAVSLVDTGRALVLQGRLGEATRCLTEAREVYRKSPPPDPYFTAWADCWFGVCLSREGKYGRSGVDTPDGRADGSGVETRSPPAPSTGHRATRQALRGLEEAGGGDKMAQGSGCVRRIAITWAGKISGAFLDGK